MITVLTTMITMTKATRQHTHVDIKSKARSVALCSRTRQIVLPLLKVRLIDRRATLAVAGFGPDSFYAEGQ